MIASFNLGRLFFTAATHEDFCGIDIRIGKEIGENELREELYLYHISLQIGYLMLSVGIIGDYV